MFLFVAGLGFEPRLAVPETAVLPLDDPAIILLLCTTTLLLLSTKLYCGLRLALLACIATCFQSHYSWTSR